ncbi:hypothetical protein TNCV_3686211 [Trichonephila clavipes]|nr:hypothetical protein TNCV_3686211 [Trichonephila clavipes]
MVDLTLYLKPSGLGFESRVRHGRTFRKRSRNFRLSRLAGLVWPEVTNDDFQQNRCSRIFMFSVIYHKTAWMNLPERDEFSIQRQCQTASDRYFKHLL